MRARVSVFLVVLFVGGAVALTGMALSWREIRCTRASGQCVLGKSSFGREERLGSFRIADVREVQHVSYRMGGAERGYTKVLLRDGSWRRVADAGHAWSEARHRELHAFFAEGRWSFVEARAHKYIGLLCPAVGLLGLALLLGWQMRAKAKKSASVTPAARRHGAGGG